MADEQTPPPIDPATPPPPPPAGDVPKEARTMGMLCHLLGIFTWFIGPLIIWLIKKDEIAFVDDQGKESLNFQITVGLAYVAISVISCVTFGIGALLFPVLFVVVIVFCIIATVQANNGERYRYPINIRLIK